MGELLKNALVPEAQWSYCYIIDDTIYTPLFDKEGNMIKTGEQVYKDRLPETPTPMSELSKFEELEALTYYIGMMAGVL